VTTTTTGLHAGRTDAVALKPRNRFLTVEITRAERAWTGEKQCRGARFWRRSFFRGRRSSFRFRSACASVRFDPIEQSTLTPLPPKKLVRYCCVRDDGDVISRRRPPPTRAYVYNTYGDHTVSGDGTACTRTDGECSVFEFLQFYADKFLPWAVNTHARTHVLIAAKIVLFFCFFSDAERIRSIPSCLGAYF